MSTLGFSATPASPKCPATDQAGTSGRCPCRHIRAFGDTRRASQRARSHREGRRIGGEDRSADLAGAALHALDRDSFCMSRERFQVHGVAGEDGAARFSEGDEEGINGRAPAGAGA